MTVATNGQAMQKGNGWGIHNSRSLNICKIRRQPPSTVRKQLSYLNNIRAHLHRNPAVFSMTTGFVFNLHQFSQGGLQTYCSSVKLAPCTEVLVHQRAKLTGETPWALLHPNPDSPLPTT